MEDLAYAPVAREIVERIGRVGPDTEALFVTDPLKADIVRALASAARAAGATATVALKPRLVGPGRRSRRRARARCVSPTSSST